jgi:hypothetical protein
MTAPECKLRGCTAWRVDPYAYCADHLARLAAEPHWVPCHVREGIVSCALCGTVVVPARRNTDGMLAALERHDAGGRVIYLGLGTFEVLTEDGLSIARHAGTDLYRSHGPACEHRPTTTV